MNAHILDNPVYNALLSGNKNLASGNNQVKYFDKPVAPFAGLQENSPENFRLLRDMLPHAGPAIIVTPGELAIPEGWSLVRIMSGLQMVCETEVKPPAAEAQLIQLTEAHVPQMLALTKLTNPGPFFEQTIQFGHYFGVFDGDRLVAMAGQRMHIFAYAEISAVCTHPDYLGKGYARQLLAHHTQRIRAANGIPMLHVRFDNERAIKVYEALGFVKRSPMNFYVLQRSEV